MPSPIAHTVAAIALTGWGTSWISPDVSRIRRRGLFPVVLALSFAADVDALPILWGGDLGRWHNQFTHSLLFAVGVGLAGAAALWRCGVRGWRRALILSWTAVGIHLLMDWTSAGRGIMLFWPFSGLRYRAPFLLFEGFHWSEGWFAARHLVTLANELAFAGAVGLLMHGAKRWRKMFDS